MIPIVVASWNMMLKPPRRCVGDISFRKSGTAWLAKPTPTPSDTRPRTSVATAAEPSEEEEEIPLFWLRRPAQEVMAAPTRKARPATSIEALSRGNINSFDRRGAVLLLIVVAIGASVWKFGRTKERKFRPLEYLGYEALAMEEDAQERLNLPSHDPVEVRQYLESYPGLEFKAQMLAAVPAGWQIDGATVIDYEVAKVAAVMYERGGAKAKESFFFFSFAGELSDLPASEPGNMRGLIFQTYASNELNLVAWQVAPGVVALLVGRRSAPELAEIALASRSAKD